MILTAAKAVPIERELERRGHRLKRMGRELVGACPRCGGTDRFAVNISKQVWNCRRCAKGGDILDLVQHLDGVRLGEAVRMLTGMTTSKPTRSPPAPTAEDKDDLWPDDDFGPTPPPPPDGFELANRIWRETVGIAGTDGEAYFHRRGIQLEDVPDYGGCAFILVAHGGKGPHPASSDASPTP